MSLSRAARLHTLAADRRPVPDYRGRFAGWAIAYALFIAYASTVVGPSGFNFVPVDPEVAWRMFKATPYITSDAGPRADWIANLLMLVPMGVLATGAFWPRRERMLRWLAAGVALFCCLLLVLSIKYLQLFFPPRTVTLNYIEAQSLGSLLGVALFWAGYDRLSLRLPGMWGNGRRSLMIVCGIYAVALLLFFLFPFDFVLSTQELRERAAILPQQLFSWPGAGLSTMHRAVVILAGSAATAPLGVLLALWSTRRSLFKIAIVGFLTMSAITLVTMLVLSAAPSLFSVVYRTAGIVIAAAVTTWFEEQDPTRWRNRLARLVPLAILPYMLAVFFVNDLLTPHWRTVPQALAALDPFGLLPFYHHYIVSKAHAAASVAVHLLTFAPIGVMVALRRGGGRAEVWVAGILAALLSFAVELGRWFKPDLQPDFSDVIIAALAAGIAAKLTAALWSTSDGQTLARPTGSARNPVRSPPMAVRQSVDRRSRADDLGGRATILATFVTAAVCLALAAVITAHYPLAPWVLAIILLLYALALWRWQSLWLAVIPAVLPAFDLTPWTGWTQVGEPDLFVLVTIGILALGGPPRRVDFWPDGLPGWVLVLSLISYVLSLFLGFALPGPEGGSDNPYLRPDNALRLAKGILMALALLPFLRARMRTQGDTMVWFGAGMVTGLALVAAAVLIERALFVGIFDFTTDYRVVGTFSSMNIGGGYIGAYLAMALPFLLVLVLRPRVVWLLAMFAIAVAAGYALVVTYARTAYAAALISLLTAGLGWAWAARRGRTSIVPAAAPLVLVPMLIGGIVMGALGSGFMAQRLRTVIPDFGGREENWSGGLALRDDSLAATLFGMGLGTYPRIVLARNPTERPTNFVVAEDGGYRLLSLRAGLPIYFAQKVAVQPDQQYRLFGALRSPDGKGTLGVILCEKMLLYSANCRGATFGSHSPGGWEDFGTGISTEGLAHPTLGRFKRPVELAFISPDPGTSLDIGHIRMLDPQGRDILANGDFSRRTERWYFTDDHHLIWRVKNQYLMSFFEGGALGLAALVLLAGTALAGAACAVGRGDRMGAIVLGSLAAFLCSSAFDDLLAVPRLATLFYLVAFSGLTMLQQARRRPTVSAIETSMPTA